MTLKKTAGLENPHAIYKATSKGLMDFEWRVLKTYQKPDREKTNPYAVWLVAARSDMTHGGWDMGDVYIQDIINFGTLVKATDEWKESYDVKSDI